MGRGGACLLREKNCTLFCQLRGWPEGKGYFCVLYLGPCNFSPFFQLFALNVNATIICPVMKLLKVKTRYFSRNLCPTEEEEGEIFYSVGTLKQGREKYFYVLTLKKSFKRETCFYPQKVAQYFCQSINLAGNVKGHSEVIIILSNISMSGYKMNIIIDHQIEYSNLYPLSSDRQTDRQHLYKTHSLAAGSFQNVAFYK